ncbi:MAG: HDOD domain-containing protein [Gammaproteobacteria bacterium]|nr:HDOD domain-containing protein [Gammaproteobacteria bacterium]
MQTKSTRTVIRELDTLPPLSDPELDIGRLVGLLQQSPSLAARILGIARSSFFAGPLPPRDLEDAVIRFLGLALVRDLSIAFTLESPLRTDKCPRFQAERYWCHALLTASLAERVAKSNRSPLCCQSYLAGLLHSLGLLALVHVAPLQMSTVFECEANPEEAQLCAIERRFLEVDHCQAGGLLAEAWQLPLEIARVMTFHCFDDYQGEHRELVALIAPTERYCRSLTNPGLLTEEELNLRLARLRIPCALWIRVVEDWQPVIDDINQLSRQLR